MKKRLLSIVCAIAAIGSSMSVVAQSVTVGTGQFTSAYTNNNDFGPMRTQLAGAASGRWAFIYPRTTVSGIPAGAEIRSLEFRREGTASITNTPNMKIYLRNATDSVYPAGNLNWVSQSAAATLVYNGNPTAEGGNSAGFKRFTLSTPFTYTGGHLEVLIEYVQPGGQTADIAWRYDNSTGVPAYVNNSTKYVINNTATFASDSTNLSNLRKPQVIFNFPAQNNVGIDRVFGSQYLLVNDSVVPSFFVKNTGLVTQTFTVALQGPGGYLSTKTVTSIASDSIHQVDFDAYAPTTTGNFTYKVFTNLASDTYHQDDTLTLPVIVADPLATSGVFDNGPIVTSPNGGFNGNALSQLSPPLTTLGLNGTIRTAEKFWLPETSNYTIDSIGFWAYQTGSGFSSNFTDVFMMIYDGDPSENGQLIHGDSAVNALSNTYFTGIMRASASSVLDSTRPIMRVLGEFMNPVQLQGGRPYWLVWSFVAGGTPFFPPITAPGIISSGDAIQRSNTTFEWALGNGGGVGFPAGAPFQIYFKLDPTSVNKLDPMASKVGQLYPNPTTENFSVFMELKRNEKVSFTITDIQGKTLLSKSFGTLPEGNHTLEMPVQGLSNGMYLVQIQSGNQLTHRKLQVN